MSTTLDQRCPYKDHHLRKAYRRGIKAAQAGKNIDEVQHGKGNRLLAFIQGYAASRTPL
jgi:hypothetical protein